MQGKLTVAAIKSDGQIGLVEEEIPSTVAGCVLLEVKSSLVSPGTDVRGWRGLAERGAPRRPDGGHRTFGYTNAGVVLEVGEGVKEFQPGNRVAAIGVGYARHATYALVPHNLVVGLPDNVSYDQGAYVMLAATALQALRRGAPGFGEYCAVVGLGLVGQLTARLYQLAGNYVVGWDLIGPRNEIATGWGIDATVLAEEQDEVEATNGFTGGAGLDSAVIAFGGDEGVEAVEKLARCMKLSPDGHRMGKIVIVGNPSIDFKGALWNVDLIWSSRTGPGYHDEEWERGGDYPPVFMRWTTRTNMELCIRLISEGKLDVDCLTTHRIPLERAEEEIADIIREPDNLLGVVFQMNR
jgi:threonine dehydrogenase-like Zn-dependent dehydrogenase